MPDCGLRLTRTHMDLLRQIGRGDVPRASRTVAVLRTLGLVDQALQLTQSGLAVLEKPMRRTARKRYPMSAGAPL
jgi:hypothetical protein